MVSVATVWSDKHEDEDDNETDRRMPLVDMSVGAVLDKKKNDVGSRSTTHHHTRPPRRLLELQDVHPALVGDGQPPNDWLALQAVYIAFGKDATNSEWWKDGSDPQICLYQGVKCNTEGRVDQLDLTGESLVGQIPTEVGLLTHLKRLGLGNNHLTGSLPTTLYRLSNLEHLEVFRNRLTGWLPQNWTSFPNLKRILVQSNRLSGSLHSSICDLDQLHGLDLFGNPLTGTLPECLQDNTLLQNIRMRDTRFTGTIPPGLCEADRTRLHGGFGCAGIACPMFTYSSLSSGAGRHPCQPCDTANVLGSSSCPDVPFWTPVPSSMPSVLTSLSPTSGVVVATSAPIPTTVFSTSDPPSSVPTLRNIHPYEPTTLPASSPSQEPSLATLRPSLRPGPTTTIKNNAESPPTHRRGAPPQNSNPSATSAGGTHWALLVAALVLSLLAMVAVWTTRRLRRQWVYTVHEEEEDPPRLMILGGPPSTATNEHDSNYGPEQQASRASGSLCLGLERVQALSKASSLPENSPPRSTNESIQYGGSAPLATTTTTRSVAIYDTPSLDGSRSLWSLPPSLRLDETTNHSTTSHVSIESDSGWNDDSDSDESSSSSSMEEQDCDDDEDDEGSDYYFSVGAPSLHSSSCGSSTLLPPPRPDSLSTVSLTTTLDHPCPAE